MKRYLTFIIGATAICNAVSCTKVEGLEVIPAPNETELTGVLCKVGSKILAEPSLRNETNYLQDALSAYDITAGTIGLTLDPKMAEEEYSLKVSSKNVVIKGGSAKGVFYGIQTLLQEMEAYGGKAQKGLIKDAPRYGWRGYMLDESRHFLGMDTVKQTLDMMARYKLNMFHWHLTDAPGWRIEIKAYPELTTTGAIGCHTDPTTPAAFYTQDQIKEIVAYATARHITVVPEIDMPGHASAANRAYPQLGIGKEAGSFTYNPGKEEVYEFLANVLKEVTELFPGPYLHVGGDEVFLGNKGWSNDPDIKALMRREGYSDISGAEGYFHKRMMPSYKKTGKQILAWDDILSFDNGGFADILTWWRHDRLDHIYQGISEGFKFVLCPREPLYFDFVQNENHTSGRKWSDGSFCPIEDVYAFPESLLERLEDGTDQNAILGLQANLWGETVKTKERADFMTYPRICAVAESAWTNAGNKNYEDFNARLGKEYALYDSMGLFYYDYRDYDHHKEPQL